MKTARVAGFKPRRSGHQLSARWPLLLPGAAAIALVMAVPLVVSLWFSVHDWRLTTLKAGTPFVGLENYLQVFRDARYWQSMATTLVFSAVALGIELLLGLGVALLLRANIRGIRIARSLIILPMVATSVVVGLTWRMLMSYDFGVINWALTALGLERVNWLGDPHLALWSIAIAEIWNSTPFVALILLAGLQSVPKEYEQAAAVDGASRLRVLTQITLPLIRPMILVATIWRTIDLMRIYDVVFAMTGGGPDVATQMISLYTYQTGFFTFNIGLASAMSYVMVAVIIALVALEVRLIGWNRT